MPRTRHSRRHSIPIKSHGDDDDDDEDDDDDRDDRSSIDHHHGERNLDDGDGDDDDHSALWVEKYEIDAQSILVQSVACPLVCSHHPIICLLTTIRIACAIHCAHSFAHSL